MFFCSLGIKSDRKKWVVRGNGSSLLSVWSDEHKEWETWKHVLIERIEKKEWEWWKQNVKRMKTFKTTNNNNELDEGRWTDEWASEWVSERETQ